jgi:hypothetical protein
MTTTTMTPEQRRAECKNFIGSDKFGWDTWLTLTVFIENVRNVESTMSIYSHLLEKLNKDEVFLAKLTDQQIKVPDQEMLRIKQHIVLDMILKAEIVAESSLVFIHELSNGYAGLSKRMARYPLEFAKNQVFRKVREMDFSLLRALGVPSIANMQLEEHEETVLNTLYQQTEDTVWEHLGMLADFYDKFKTVYNKYRHGLILRTGTARTNNNDNNSNAFNLENSAFEALDYKSPDDLPKDCKIVDKDINNLVPGMFNALSHVSITQKLLDEIFAIVGIAKEIVAYVCRSHKLYALNCGQSYLPIGFKDGKQPYLAFLLPEDALAGHKKVLDSIANKISQEMNHQTDVTVEEFTYKNDSLIQPMLNNTVTNIFVRPKP